MLGLGRRVRNESLRWFGDTGDCNGVEQVLMKLVKTGYSMEQKDRVSGNRGRE